MMLRLVFVLVVCLVSSAVTQETGGDNDEARVTKNFAMARVIYKEMNFFDVDRFCLDRPKIAKLLRFIFHDCIGNGGCDGCIDLDNKANNGLDEIFAELNKLYVSHFNKTTNPDALFDISRADLHVIAAFVASDLGSGGRVTITNQRDRAKSTKLVRAFHEGRTSCSGEGDETDTQEVFPRNDFNKGDMLKWFDEQMGFNSDEVTAIMGAHTLGKVQKFKDAGIPSRWVTNNPSLNNCVYRRLFRPFKQTEFVVEENVSEFHWQKRNEVFLHCDMALLYEFEVDENGKASCNPCRERCYDEDGDPITEKKSCKNCCQRWNEETVGKYKNDNNAWVAEFRTAMLKMTGKARNVFIEEAPEVADALESAPLPGIPFIETTKDEVLEKLAEIEDELSELEYP